MVKAGLVTVAIAALAIAPAFAQQAPAPAGGAAAGAPAPIKRTILQRTDAPGGATEVVLGIAEIGPHTMVGRHSHPGVVMAQVLEGEFRLALDGEPERVYKAGESFTIPDGAVHNEGAAGPGAKVTAVYVVQKGKPLATPAP